MGKVDRSHASLAEYELQALKELALLGAHVSDEQSAEEVEMIGEVLRAGQLSETGMLPTEFDSEALELGVLALDKREQAVFLHGEVGLNGPLEHALYVPGTFSPIFRQQDFEGGGTVVP